MFRPSPCPSHYAGHLTTMPSADFCLITRQGYPCRRYRLLSCLLEQPDKFCSPSLLKPVAENWKGTDRVLSRSPRIRTCTFAALLHHLRWPCSPIKSSTWLRRLVPTRLQPTPHMMFLFISSQFCVRLPSDQTSRAGLCHSLVVSI